MPMQDHDPHFELPSSDYRFPAPRSNTSPNANAIPPSPGIPEPRRALPAWTAGGEGVNILLPGLSSWQHGQHDTSLNSDIWSVFPVEKTEQELGREVDAAHRVLAKKDPGIAQYQLATLYGGIEMFEHATITTALLILCEVYRGLSKGGKALRHPLEALKRNKKKCSASSLQDAVAVAQLRKADGDTLLDGGDTWSAIQEYTEALVGLYPWIPTRILFTAEDAFTSGLAQLYSNLWLSLAEAANARHKVLAARGINTFNWQIVVYQVASLVTAQCFVDRPTLSAAFKLLSETNMAFSRTISSVAGYSEYTFSEAALDAKESARCQSYLSDLVGRSHEKHQAEADQDAQGLTSLWAHRDCVDVHSGCGCNHEDVRALLRGR